MSDQTLSAVAGALFVLSLALVFGVLYIEWFAPWLIDEMVGY